MSKQSSIELFAIALYEKGFLKGNGDDINDLLEEAKAMHKEERFQDFKEGFQAAVESLQGANNLVQSKKLGGNNE